MRSLFRIGIILLVVPLLVQCATYYHRPSTNAQYVDETWMRAVDMTSRPWLHGASTWFISDNDQLKMLDRALPRDMVMSTMHIHIPYTLTTLNVKGRFKVQIVESDQATGVTLYGPYQAVRCVNVVVTPQTLYLTESNHAPLYMHYVIVRVNLKYLTGLTQNGVGQIEGRLMRGSLLYIVSQGTGDIYLRGLNRLKSVTVKNKGNVTVLNAVTPFLTVTTDNQGSMNASGRVGIAEIIHHGSGDINIIGVDTDRLSITADGQGKIGLAGRLVINKIVAKDHMCVYAFDVSGHLLDVQLMNNASVGLKGHVHTVYVDAHQTSQFLGRYLYVQNAFLRANDAAHINTATTHQLFATANADSSIYYFVTPKLLNKTVNGSGVILPIMSWGGEVNLSR